MQPKNITTKEQYLKEVAYLENLAKKCEDSLTENEIRDIYNTAIAVERYEDDQLHG